MSIHPEGPSNNTSAGQGDLFLVSDGQYIHCGEPMQKLGSEMRRLTAPVFTDRPAEDALAVYLMTRVMRCSCGFQIDVPD